MTAPPLLLGVVAKEPVYAPELNELTPFTDSMICAGCDGEMQLVPDAIGRLRKRCPKCHGIAKRRHNPNDPMLPQALVPAVRPVVVLSPLAPIITQSVDRVVERIVVQTIERVVTRRVEVLPPIGVGQIRCQRCAGGIDDGRFCAPCLKVRTNEAQKARRAEVAAGRIRTCLTCGATEPHIAGLFETKDCAKCRPPKGAPRTYRRKPCRGCTKVFQPTGPRSELCEACR